MSEETLDVEVEQAEDVIELTDEPIARNEQKIHSYSRINLYETCPYLYKCVYIDRKKGGTNPIMLIGRVAHEAVSLYNKACIDNKISNDHENWEKYYWQALKKENINTQYHEDIKKLFKAYVDAHEIDLESVIGAEEKIAINRNYELVDWLSDDVWIRGIIDYLQIEGTICKITDYKMGYAMKSDPYQMKFYGWLIKKLYPQVTDVQIEINHIRYEYVETFTMTERDIEEFEKSVLNRLEHIEEQTKFEPNIGIQCSYCPMWFCCPSMKHEDEALKMPKDPKEAEQIALKLEKYSKLALELKKILKEYCDKAGKLEAGGAVYDFKISTTYAFDALDDLYIELDKLGINLMEYVNIDNRKLKGLMKTDSIDKIVKVLAKKKVSVRFTKSKSDKDDE